MAAKITAEKRSKIIQLWQLGHKKKSIADTLGVDISTVRYNLNKFASDINGKINRPNTILHMMPSGAALKSDYGVR